VERECVEREWCVVWCGGSNFFKWVVPPLENDQKGWIENFDAFPQKRSDVDTLTYPIFRFGALVLEGCSHSCVKNLKDVLL